MCYNGPLPWRTAAVSSLGLLLFMAACIAPFLSHSAHASSPAVLQAFTDRFARTTGEQFYELWHSDCHRRCRAQLIGHVTLACTFDPYKLTKRQLTKREVNSTIARIVADTEDNGFSPFLPKMAATTFLHKVSQGKSVPSGRRSKRGIMNECCYSKACSWEEYAEFCHTYNRRPAIRDTLCFP